MNLLIFSEKDPVRFQSKRQLLWLLEFVQENYKEITIEMKDSFDSFKINYDAVLIHGYDTKSIKKLRKNCPSAKLLLLNPGLLTFYRDKSLTRKQKIKAKKYTLSKVLLVWLPRR